MNNSSSLIINKLVLVGIRKNYEITFEKGLNIIYGDSDTGKSSILDLINYCLGSKKVILYDELEYSGKYCLLELSLNNNIYVIKRDLFDPNDFIYVYFSDIETMDKVFPLEYGPNYNKEGSSGYLSDFLLQSLNIPLIKVKKAPTKEDSDHVRVGFRDIFKFCYVDQDEVGSRYLLDAANGAVAVKNREVFKFLHNVLDTQIMELENLRSENIKSRNNLDNKLNIISSFMRETQVKPIDMLNDKLENLESDLVLIDNELKDLNDKMYSNTKYSNELREIINNLKNDIKKLDSQKAVINSNITQNIRLKKEYTKDIIKLESALKIKQKFPDYTYNEINCPVCCKKINISDLKDSLENSDIDYLKEEVKNLNLRKRNLTNMIDKSINDINIIDSKKEHSLDALNNAEILFDEETKDFLSPFISQRDGLIKKHSFMLEQKNNLLYFIKMRNQLETIVKQISSLNKKIDELSSKIEKLKDAAPSTSAIVNSLADYLKDFLEFVKIRNCTNISVSTKTFMPIVRGKDYIDLSSGGLRTITSVGFFLSFLLNSLNSDTNIPKFLMIDTIGKYLGKTKDKYLTETNKNQDLKEGLNDPDKYLNMYKYLINLCDKFTNNNLEPPFQIIIVDNDIPLEFQSTINSYVIKRFSVLSKDGFDIGFIDDMNLVNSPILS